METLTNSRKGNRKNMKTLRKEMETLTLRKEIEKNT